MRRHFRERLALLVILGAVGGTAEAADRTPPPDLAGHWSYYNNMGWHAYFRGDYDLAYNRFSKAIETVRPYPDQFSRLLSRSCHDLTRVLCVMERHADAEEMAKWVVQVREADSRTREDVLFDSLYLLAVIHRTQGNDADAVPLLRKAVAIEERNLGLRDPRLAVTLKELADVESRSGDLLAAEGNYRRAISIHKRFSSVNLDLADALGEHAKVLAKLGRNDDAETRLAEAESIRGDEFLAPRIADHLKEPLAANAVRQGSR